MPTPLATRGNTLSPAEFRGFAALPAEAEWLANIWNAHARLMPVACPRRQCAEGNVE